jgi:hypothetical protein
MLVDNKHLLFNMQGINIKVANVMLARLNNAFPASFPETKLPSLGLLLI